MKKVVLILIVLASAYHAYAQEADSLQHQPRTISIDSLSVRLNRLQHDYDFLKCDYELSRVLMDLKDLSHSIEITSNAVTISFYNERFNRSLYNAYLDNYDSNYALFNSLKEKVESAGKLVLLKMMVSGFSDAEIDVLTSTFGTIQKAVAAVENSLNLYEASIKVYKSKR